ncbi:hypothetical protein G6F56_001117 [Rhizopus delemar]|nr:hypothetical protein G6F56_001117 [Rhizopus delemar]
MSEPREYHELELLAEIIGFLPKKIHDELYDHMNIIIYNVMEGVNERLEEMHKDKAIIIFDQFKAYERELETLLDKAFNRFEQYMYTQVWKLPAHLDIQIYNDSINLDINEETEDAMNEYIDALRVKTRAQKILNIKLKRELQSVEYQKRSYDTFRRLARFLSEASKKRSLLNLEETMGHVKNQIDELTETIDEVLATVDEMELNNAVDLGTMQRTESIRNVLEILSKK